MKYYCNPVNLEYHYQYSKRDRTKKIDNLFNRYREAADPTLILFKGKYLMFTSMSSGFYESENLCDWKFHRFTKDMPIYDYAPDVCIVGEYLYFSASKRDEVCDFYRTKDPIHEPFEKVPGSFDFWDPNMFKDDDGKLYLYWGCSNISPLYGVELDTQTLQPLHEPKELLDSHEECYGFERNGENYVPPKSQEEIEVVVQMMMKQFDLMTPEMLKERGLVTKADAEAKIRSFAGNRPCVEGAWMNKYQGNYYLQYATPGTQYNVYCDAVYIADSPLGPFTMAKNNPYSYKPEGFITGAGHGSTLKDKLGIYWHASTMRISKNDRFERRIGLWKAGFDTDGELYCDQRYGDWPIAVDAEPFEDPAWMLLSYGKQASASSGAHAEYVCDEDIRTWWKPEINKPEEWVEVDLGKEMMVHAVQINFADDTQKVELPEDVETFYGQEFTRYLDPVVQTTNWVLQGSVNGQAYVTLLDKSEAATDLPHDVFIHEEGMKLRYIRLVTAKTPYDAIPCISGLRVFGKADGDVPKKVQNVILTRESEVDVKVTWDDEAGITAYNVLWGHHPDKLYHSCITYGKNTQTIGALTKGQDVFIRVDACNEVGITKGTIQKL